MDKGIVYLVGAGPGDPGLITVRGLECIQKADVLVYDRLASTKLLGYAPEHAEMIYVGKSPDQHAMKQGDINRLLADKALEGKVVTRLKGGDPFVFGRGGEEAELLQEMGISFEVVPGVTSAVAVPAYAGIPVTHRGVTSTLTIITGNEDPTKEDSDIRWDCIAGIGGTLVFLMGMGNLPKIVAQLVSLGRDEKTPVALVRWGTRPEQRTLVGTLQDIVGKALAADFKNPAVIVVGEVVTLRDKLQWFENKPLFGQRVLVTRSREQASALSEAIRTLGGEPVEFPTIRVTDPEDYAPLDEAIQKIETYHWVIFTSVNGVDYFFRRMKHHGRDVRAIKGKLCAIGPKTMEALESFGLLVDYVPGEYRAEEIIAGLQDKLLPGQQVLLPRADIARKVLPESLISLGAQVEEVVAYQTVEGQGDATMMRDMLQKKAIQMITFTSSSTVRNFVRLLGEDALPDLLEGVTLACIGPITADTAKELHLPVHVVASQYTIDGLVEAIVSQCAQS